MKRVRAVIFDCDGVMFDSRQANVNFYNHILANFGHPPMTEDETDFVHMHTAEESLKHIFRNSPHKAEALDYRKKLDYTPFIKFMIVEPGLKELLEYLKPKCGLAVATNRSTTIGKVLDDFGLSGYFNMVVSCLDVENPKPHPESLYKIMDFFGICPEECVYIGDSEVDFKVCRAAGVPLIAYKNRELDADLHVDALLEVRHKIHIEAD